MIEENQMAHYGTLRDFRFIQSGEDLDDVRGSHLYGLNDEKLGKIDDVIFDHSSGDIRYVVVDTGGWLSSKKFIVPADRIRPSENHEDDFSVELSKQQVESFPPYNEKDVESQDKWKDYENRYRSKWEAKPVMHRAETDRNITPTTQQMTQGSGATGPVTGTPEAARYSSRGLSSEDASSRADVGSERLSSESMDLSNPATDDVTISNSAAGIGARWDTFQSRLRQRRREVISSCTTCSVGPMSERDQTGTERKAV
jgi:PRC-barrel domain